MGLSLTRKEGETIILGNDIKIEVRRIRASSVLLAITAPDNIRVLRGEILKEQRLQNAAE
tara:strand:- start:190 stop:369 length:180 start_codon:yes stop_codon:yes gene_type:complete